jgi:hypothetical protein
MVREESERFSGGHEKPLHDGIIPPENSLRKSSPACPCAVSFLMGLRRRGAAFYRPSGSILKPLSARRRSTIGTRRKDTLSRERLSSVRLRAQAQVLPERACTQDRALYS